jgi:hypothetical protein
MNKEAIFHKSELESLAAGLEVIFIQRHDLYPRQLDDGSYICIRKPLENEHLIAHLKGEITLGAYVLNEASQARYIMFDADEDDELENLIGMARQLTDKCVPSYLEGSRRGGHLWFFFSLPIPGKDARLFGKSLIKTYHLGKVELFPKQDKLGNGPGSLVRLPFGFHRRVGKRYGFLTLDKQPLEESFSSQIIKLRDPETVPEGFLIENMGDPSAKSQTTGSVGVEAPTIQLSTRIKRAISAFDFISQYVELSSEGRGLCPFHEDQHESFSVDLEKNYWYCFAGCGGGSIIDFWMKWDDCDFKTAIRELASLLL